MYTLAYMIYACVAGYEFSTENCGNPSLVCRSIHPRTHPSHINLQPVNCGDVSPRFLPTWSMLQPTPVAFDDIWSGHSKYCTNNFVRREKFFPYTAVERRRRKMLPSCPTPRAYLIT